MRLHVKKPRSRTVAESFCHWVSCRLTPLCQNHRLIGRPHQRRLHNGFATVHCRVSSGLNLGLMRKSASSTISRSRFPIFKTSFPRTPVQRRDAHWQFPSVNGRFTPQNAWDALAAMDYPEDVARNSQVLMRFFPIMDPDPVTPSSNAGVRHL